MLRLGFFLGFLVGSAIASLMAMPDEEESATEADGGPLDQLKRQAREARQAARRAAADKEAEMIKDWEETRHQSG